MAGAVATIVVPVIASLAPVAIELFAKYGPIVGQLVLNIASRDMNVDFLKPFTSNDQLDKIQKTLVSTGKSYISLPQMFNILGISSASIVLGKILTDDIQKMKQETEKKPSSKKSKNTINPDIAALTQLIVTGLQKSSTTPIAKGEYDADDDASDYDLLGTDDDDGGDGVSTIGENSSYIASLVCLFNHPDFERLCHLTAVAEKTNQNN